MASEAVAPIETPEGLWSGDTGGLPDRTRRVLLRLIGGPYLSGAREAQLWSVLLSDEAVIRSRLADLYLELVIDRGEEFAFVRNAPSEEAPRAVRAQPLTFLDTAMLLVLRQTLLSEEGRGRVYVGQAEVFEQLAVYRTPDRDEKDFATRLNSSWNKMQNKLRVLHPSGEERAEISPVLRLIVDADQVRAITAEYRRIADDGGTASEANHAVDDEDVDAADDEDTAAAETDTSEVDDDDADADADDEDTAADAETAADANDKADASDNDAGDNPAPLEFGDAAAYAGEVERWPR